MSDLVQIVLEDVKPEHMQDPDILVGELTGKFRCPDSAWLDHPNTSPFDRVSGSVSEEAAKEEAFLVRQLTSKGMLYDVSMLKLDAKSLGRVIRSRARVGNPNFGHLLIKFGLADEVAEGLYCYDGTENIPDVAEIDKAAKLFCDDLATRLATLADRAPIVVKLAIQGRLASAAAAIHATRMSWAEKYDSRGEVLDLLEKLGQVHLIDSLADAAEDARRRFYEPTGCDYLDYNGDGVATTIGCVLRRMDAQMFLLDLALDLHALGVFIPRNDPRLRRFKTGNLEAAARAIEASLIEFGDIAAPDQTLARLRTWIMEFKRELATLKGQGPLRQQNLAYIRGPHPLQMLAFATSFAVGWMDPCEPSGLCVRRRDDEIGGVVTRLRRSLDASARGAAPIVPALHHQNHESTAFFRRAFYILRNLEVRDPDSSCARFYKKHKAVIDFSEAFRRNYEAESAKLIEQEPFSSDFEKGLERLYINVKDGEPPKFNVKRGETETEASSRKNAIAKAFVAEAEGRISLQLRM